MIGALWSSFWNFNQTIKSAKDVETFASNTLGEFQLLKVRKEVRKRDQLIL